MSQLTTGVFSSGAVTLSRRAVELARSRRAVKLALGSRAVQLVEQGSSPAVKLVEQGGSPAVKLVKPGSTQAVKLVEPVGHGAAAPLGKLHKLMGILLLGNLLSDQGSLKGQSPSSSRRCRRCRT